MVIGWSLNAWVPAHKLMQFMQTKPLAYLDSLVGRVHCWKLKSKTGLTMVFFFQPYIYGTSLITVTRVTDCSIKVSQSLRWVRPSPGLVSPSRPTPRYTTELCYCQMHFSARSPRTKLCPINYLLSCHTWIARW